MGTYEGNAPSSRPHRGNAYRHMWVVRGRPYRGPEPSHGRHPRCPTLPWWPVDQADRVVLDAGALDPMIEKQHREEVCRDFDGLAIHASTHSPRITDHRAVWSPDSVLCAGPDGSTRWRPHADQAPAPTSATGTAAALAPPRAPRDPTTGVGPKPRMITEPGWYRCRIPTTPMSSRQRSQRRYSVRTPGPTPSPTTRNCLPRRCGHGSTPKPARQSPQRSPGDCRRRTCGNRCVRFGRGPSSRSSWYGSRAWA